MAEKLLFSFNVVVHAKTLAPLWKAEDLRIDPKFPGALNRYGGKYSISPCAFDTPKSLFYHANRGFRLRNLFMLQNSAGSRLRACSFKDLRDSQRFRGLV